MPLVSLCFLHLFGMVNLGSTRTSLRATARRTNARLSPSTHDGGVRPPCPTKLVDSVEDAVGRLSSWLDSKDSVLCITGAGISTDSNIPDYRGSNGSYHRGHKPTTHDKFLRSEHQRKRYWGRSMAGWKAFASSEANAGHYALTALERSGHLGVSFDDMPDFYASENEADWVTSTGSRTEAIITKNVDGLHQRAGSVHVTNLHGRNDRLRCMACGSFQCRHKFQNHLDDRNGEWLRQILEEQAAIDNLDGTEDSRLRPDGDADISTEDYSGLVVPTCASCSSGILKPDVVFFGDSVPRHRVDRCYAAVAAADGILCIGTSLAVHSAYRFVLAAAKNDTAIAILNVGETRAEINNLDVMKVEAPIGPTLSGVASALVS